VRATLIHWCAGALAELVCYSFDDLILFTPSFFFWLLWHWLFRCTSAFHLPLSPFQILRNLQKCSEVHNWYQLSVKYFLNLCLCSPNLSWPYVSVYETCAELVSPSAKRFLTACLRLPNLCWTCVSLRLPKFLFGLCIQKPSSKFSWTFLFKNSSSRKYY
jgi:hypothetical protein